MFIQILKEKSALSPIADTLELRFDTYPIEEAKILPIPWILTLRRSPAITEEKRLRTIEHLLSFHPTYCDLETDVDPYFLNRMARLYSHIKWIGSYHNLTSCTPKFLRHPLFFHYKMALRVQSSVELLELLLKAAHTPDTSWIPLGEEGSPGRILGPIVGTLLNYTAVEPDVSLGQISISDLIDIYRYPTLNPTTKIYALLGDPVSHSIGHLFHNHTLPIGCVYIKCRVTKEELVPFLTLARKLPFAGFSLTAPLKEAIIPLLDHLTPSARNIGAVNTIRVDSGRLIGTNTDAPAALKGLQPMRTVILGTGGSARAIAYEASRLGSAVTFLNRHTLSTLSTLSYDLLVNTIPHCKNPFPINPTHLRPFTTILDINYVPKETPLLQAGKAIGCTCLNGEGMFYAQAKLQQAFWLQK